MPNSAKKNGLAREIVTDSRVLIEHARLLVRNSNSRIDRIAKLFEKFMAASDASEANNGAVVKPFCAEIARWLDRRAA